MHSTTWVCVMQQVRASAYPLRLCSGLRQYTESLMLYSTGLGVRQDQVKATRWFQSAADKGDLESVRVMAIRISEGKGCQSDARAATSTYVRAAEAGDATSEFNLGVRYASGQGIAAIPSASTKAFYFGGGHEQDAQTKKDAGPQDVVEDFSNFEEERDFSQTRIALEWYKRAAAKGHCKALYNLASMMAKGEGLPLSQDDAADLLLQAARQGYARAQYALALHLTRQADTMRRSCASHGKGRRERGKAVSQSGASLSREMVTSPAGEGASAAAATTIPNAGAEANVTSRRDLSEREKGWEGGEVDSASRHTGVSTTFLRPKITPQDIQGPRALDEESVRWLVAASESRYAKASYALGLRFAEGRGGVERNLTTAIGYFLRYTLQVLWCFRSECAARWACQLALDSMGPSPLPTHAYTKTRVLRFSFVAAPLICLVSPRPPSPVSSIPLLPPNKPCLPRLPFLQR